MAAKEQGYEGIVVLGVPRSGTTLMRRILNAHPNICCPPETNLLRSCARFLDEEPIDEGLAVGVLSGLAYSDFAEDAVLARLREFAFAFHREIAAKAGKKRWAEKTAFDVFHVDTIERLVSNTCRFVCVFRHGLDTVCSMKELTDTMDRYLVELHPYIRRCPSPYEAFAHAWVDGTSALLQLIARRPGQCHALQYESLLAQPETRLKELLDFLGEPAEPEDILRRALGGGAEVGLGDWKTYDKAGLDRSSVGRSAGLSDATIARLAPILNPTLKVAGYDPVSIPKAASGASARERYRASKMVRQLKARAGISE